MANADEGDAGTYCDRMMILEGDPFRLLEGMLICARAIRAGQGYVYCRQEYPAAAALRAAIQKPMKRSCWSCMENRFRSRWWRGRVLRLRRRDGLLESLEGKRGVVRARPPYPAQSGLYGCPTIVSNVPTFASIPIFCRVVAHGTRARRHRTVSWNHRVYSWAGGEASRAGRSSIRAELASGAGAVRGRMAPNSRFKAVQVGGPLGALPSTGLDIAICYDAFAKAGAVLGHGGIVVYDQRDRHGGFGATLHGVHRRRVPEMYALSDRFGAGREILERIQAGVEPWMTSRLLDDLGETMKLASLCALGGRAPYPVLTAIEHFPQSLK